SGCAASAPRRRQRTFISTSGSRPSAWSRSCESGCEHAACDAHGPIRREVAVTVRMAINGFGRIGRLVLRAAIETGRSDIQVVAINDLAPPETNAHLLRYDSVHGRFPGKVQLEGNEMDCGTGPIRVLAERDVAKLPWRDLKVDVVAECTGIFTKRDVA